MQFIKFSVRKLKPYTYGEQPTPEEGLIKLNTNENPYPPGKDFKKVVENFPIENLRLYPDPLLKTLKKNASDFLGIPEQNLFFGNGSDEILSLIFRIFFDSKDLALFTQYTYTVYHALAGAVGVNYTTLPMNENDFSINLDLMERIRAKVFFLVNPNAPTGKAYPVKKLEYYIKKHKATLFVIDEAYADFNTENCLKLAVKYPNVIVVRTLSKAYAMCGIRLGYAVAPSGLIEAFDKVSDSYNVNALTQHIGAAVFKNPDVFIRNIEKIKQTRERFIQTLSREGFHVIPSSANFVLVRFSANHAEKLYNYLKQQKIYVRFFNNPVLNQYLRISIGTDEDMDKVFFYIKKYFQELTNHL